MKTELIYNEVISMLNSGADYQSITLSEIAKRCDMGKSTIYEYFSSKDEMVFNSLVYYLDTVIKYFDNDWEGNFEEKMPLFIKIIIVTMKANKWLVLPWTFDTYKNYFTQENQEAVTKLLSSAQNLIMSTFELIVNNNFDNIKEDNIKFAFFGLVAFLSDCIDENIDITGQECNNIVDKCVLLLKEQLQ